MDKTDKIVNKWLWKWLGHGAISQVVCVFPRQHFSANPRHVVGGCLLQYCLEWETCWEVMLPYCQIGINDSRWSRRFPRHYNQQKRKKNALNYNFLKIFIFLFSWLTSMDANDIKTLAIGWLVSRGGRCWLENYFCSLTCYAACRSFPLSLVVSYVMAKWHEATHWIIWIAFLSFFLFVSFSFAFRIITVSFQPTGGTFVTSQSKVFLWSCNKISSRLILEHYYDFETVHLIISFITVTTLICTNIYMYITYFYQMWLYAIICVGAPFFY